MSIRKFSSAISCFAVCFCTVWSALYADTIVSTNTSYFVGPLVGWSDGNPPSSENDYLVNNGKYISTGVKTTATIVFEGKSLTIGDATTKGNIIFGGLGTLSVPCGITIYGADGHVNYGWSGNQLTEHHHIAADLTLMSTHRAAPQFSTQFRSNGQYLYFDGAVNGDENTGMKFYGNEWSNCNTNDIIAFTGDLTKYYGYIDINGCTKVTVSGTDTICTNTLILALGNVEFPGAVMLTDGPYAFLRTLETDDYAKIDTLVLPDGANLYPEVDLLNGRCGCIEVTNSFQRSGKQTVVAKFLSTFDSSDHARMSLPLLKVSESAGALDADDFTLCTLDAGDAPENAFSLRVADDSMGVPTLYLDIAAYSTDGVTDVMLTTSDANLESAFLSEWSSHWFPAGLPAPGRRYHVTEGKELRTPYLQGVGTVNKEPFGEPVTFGGDAIVLGDESSSGIMSHWTWARVSVPELIVSNGTYVSGGDYSPSWPGLRGGLLDSQITIAATDPSKAVFKTGNTWQHLYLEGTLKGDANAAMRFLFTNANSDMHLNADCSEYLGLIEVSATSANGANVADFRIGAEVKEIQGTLRLGSVTDATGGKVKLSATNGLDVANLVVNRPTAISVTVKESDYSSDRPPLTVTGTMTLNSEVSVDVTVSGEDPILSTDNLDAAFVPVMKWPKALSVDESLFDIGTVTFSGRSVLNSVTPVEGFFTVSFIDEGDMRVMGIEKKRIITLLVADDSVTNTASQFRSARTSFDECYEYQSDRAYGWNWSDGLRPHPDCDYFAATTLRTHSEMTDVYFQGHALFLKGTLILQSDATTVSNLYMLGGILLHMHEGGDRVVNGFAPGGTQVIRGKAYVSATQTGSSIVAPYLANVGCLNVALELSGPGNIKAKMRANDNYPLGVDYPSYLEFSGDNSGWNGLLECSAENSTKYSDTECLTVLFSDQDNLGADLDKFTYNGITLKHSSILKPRSSVTYSRANRGVFIEGTGGLYPDDGVTFAVNAQVTYHGRLRKLGGGTLTFGGSAKFLQTDGTTVGDIPVSGAESNVLHVLEGSVGVTKADACDGVKAVFEDGASLCVKVSGADDDLAAKGWTSVKTDTPFVLNASDGKLPVTFDVGGLAADGSVYETAICTVSAAAAEKLRGKFRLRRPGLKGYVAEITGETTDGANVTFKAKLKHSAMRVIFR